MAEWSKALAWKVSIRQNRIEGSNPSRSATLAARVPGDAFVRELLPALLALSLSLGGCGAIPLAPAAIEVARESALQRRRYTDESFPPAAEEACRARAARHGRIEITKIEPHGADAVRVYGTIDRFAGSQGRSFACVFRRDGNMPYFRID